jgi:hypothetical protein
LTRAQRSDHPDPATTAHDGIRVALLVVDTGIQPLHGSTRAGVSPEAPADPRGIADAALFLANQDARSATHEIQLTPLAENWTP